MDYPKTALDHNLMWGAGRINFCAASHALPDCVRDAGQRPQEADSLGIHSELPCRIRPTWTRVGPKRNRQPRLGKRSHVKRHFSGKETRLVSVAGAEWMMILEIAA